MAKKASSAKTKKQHTPDYYPIVRTIPLGVDGGTLSGTTVADCGKLLSIANRRLYRQGKMYHAKIDLDVDFTVDADIEFEVYALVNNWDIQRAYALARATYDRAMQDEAGVLRNNVARWSDFRVNHGVTGASDLDPVYFELGSLAATIQNHGEHELSEVDVGGTSTTFAWASGIANSLDMIAEWQKAGQVSQTPSGGSSSAAYDGVNSDDLSNTEMVDLREKGDLPPYKQTSSAQVWVRVGTLYYRPAATPTVMAGMTRTSTGFFEAPCGLIALKSTGADLSNGSVRLTVKSGDYKGVSAHAMCQE